MPEFGVTSSGIPLYKLSAPQPPASQLPRSGLLGRVAAAASVRLILLGAPPGFGKSTLMQQLRGSLVAQGCDTIWLNLDSSDNDAARFLISLRAACRRPDSGTLVGEGSDLDPIAALATRTDRFALFLDDFEVIHEASVLAMVRLVIEQLPRSGIVVIGSRSLPDIGLSRMRAQGQLLELGADSLRFTPDEVETYFKLRGQLLQADVVSKLHEKTEGWIAALWLASLAMERPGHEGYAFVEQFSGSNRTIADYLADNVLAHEEPEVREFLLRTSVLRQVNADVAQALVPRSNVEPILKRLVSQSLFLVSDGDEGTYRYHRLVADFLQARLLRDDSEVVPRLHLAASGWYESQGRIVPAIDHAIEGGDFPYALELLQGHTQRFLEGGRLRLLARWFNAMPLDLVRQNPSIHCASVWAKLLTKGPTGAANELEFLRESARNDLVVAAHVNALGPLYLAMLDRYEEAHEEGMLSLDRLPTCNEFADSVLRDCMANVFAVMGDRRRAQDLIDQSRRVPGAFNQMYTESVEGMLDVQGGRLREATARFRLAVTATSSTRRNFTGGNAWAGVLYATTLYEANELGRAEQLINVYLPLACDVGLPGHMIVGHIIRTRISFNRGDIVTAFETLTALEYLGHHRGLQRLVVTAKIERGRLLLLQGNAQASKEEIDRADMPEVWGRIRRLSFPANDTDFLSIARIRWDLHFGDARSALTLIDQELQEAIELSRQRRVLKLKMMRAIALQRTGDPSTAAETIADVLRQAAGDGFVRLLADEGPIIGLMIKHFQELLLEMPARRSDPVLLEYLQRLLGAFGPLPPSDNSVAIPAESLMEPLTRKELQVLQLAAEGYSNAAMAEKLVLSDSTVRTHLRNINAKLNAKSRVEAVAIARRLGVVR